MKKLFSILSVVLLISACHHQEHLCRQYSGVLPAADAAGIQTTITFNRPASFQNKLVFIDKANGTFEESGSYSVKDELITLRDSNGDESYYRLEKDQIRRLDMEKQPVTGALAEHYVLKCIEK